MSTGLALRPEQSDWTDVQRAALAQIGIEKAPKPDQLVFLHICQRLGLDPFAKQIYMIGRKDDDSPGGKKWTVQTGIDGFRVFSERHPQYGGALDPEWCGADGVWRDVWLEVGPPAAARFTVIRRDQEQAISAVALYREYVQTKYDGKPNSMWTKMPANQLAKCAEALARRRAFPRDLAGIYTDEEMGQADSPSPVVIAQSERDDRPAEPDWDAELTTRHGDAGKLKELLDLARGIRCNDGGLLNRISQAWREAKTARPPEPAPPEAPEPPAPAPAGTGKPPPRAQPVGRSRMAKLVALMAEGNLTTTEGRLRLAAHVLERDVADFASLTATDIEDLITRLQELKDDGRLGRAALDEAPADATGEEGG